MFVVYYCDVIDKLVFLVLVVIFKDDVLIGIC